MIKCENNGSGKRRASFKGRRDKIQDKEGKGEAIKGVVIRVKSRDPQCGGGGWVGWPSGWVGHLPISPRILGSHPSRLKDFSHRIAS